MYMIMISKNDKPSLKFGIKLSSFLLLSVSTHAGVIAYQSFDFPAQTIGPASTAMNADENENDFGFTAPKSPSGRMPLVVIGDGLTYADAEGNRLEVNGRAAMVPPGDSSVYPLFALPKASPFSDLQNPEKPGQFAPPGSDIWVSFLMRSDGPLAPDTTFYLKAGSGKISAGLCNNERSEGAFFRLSGPRSHVVMQPDKSYLIVIRYQFGMSGGNDDRVSMWINPVLGSAEPVSYPDAEIEQTNVYVMDFWTVVHSKTSDFKGYVDEIRVGESYADVTPMAR